MKETTQKQPKYTLRKKRTGGGAASVLVGTMILSGMVIAGKSEKVVHADTLEPTTNQENTGENLANVSEYTLRSTPTVTKKDELAETADQPASISEATTNVADVATSTSNSGSPETTTIDEATTSAPVPTTSTAPVVSRANAETPPVWAAEPQVTITNIHMNKDKVIESQGTDIQVAFDWEATGIYKGYKIETPLPEAFDSITKQVKYTFGTTEIPNMGTMTLDYENHKLITEFTYDMNPLKIYRGKTTVGTFINRNYFTELDTKRNVYFQTADGKTVSIPLEVVYDEVQRYSTSGQDYNYNVVYVTATHQKLTEDGSQSNVTWHGIVNAGNIQMKDLALYASPQLINKVYRTTGTDPRNRVVIDFATAQSHTFTMLPDSFAIYEVEVYPSMGFDRNTMKKLVLGKDYEIIPGIPGDPNGFIFHMIGDYADTTKSLIMEGTAHYENLTPDEGEVSEGSTKTEVQGSAALSYLDPSNKVVPGDFSAVVTLMNSEMTSISSEEDTDAKGSVIVVHIAGDTGELLSAEEYVAHDVEVGTHYTTEAGNFTNIGYEFNRMGYLSAPATGSVQDGVLRVTYVYMPIAKTGSVDVKYVDTEGNILPGGEVQAVKTDVPAGTNYETDPKTFAGYEFVGMAETSAKADGTIIADQTLHVIYVYRKLAEPVVKKGSVDVKYIDRATGKEIPGGELAAVVTDAEAGTSYGTSKKDFDGYTFAGLDEKSAAASGKVEADTTLHVIYTYDKLPDPVVEKGSVDVIYVDEHGNVLPGGDLKVVKDNVPVGESYSTTQKDFAGYTFVRMGTGSADVSGKVTPGTQHVIYVYSKNVIPEIKKGSVDVKYIDRATGQEIPGGELAAVVTDAEAGTSYNTAKKDFTGYTFAGLDEKSAAASGKVEADTTLHVIYTYDKLPDPVVEKGSVDVIYVDEHGNVLPGGDLKVVKDNVPVGESYSTTQKDFAGYTFVRMGTGSATVNGKVTPGTQHVIYVYSKNLDPVPEIKRGTVTVVYVDEQGNPLPGGDETVVKDNVPVGEGYTTTQREFSGYTFTRLGEGSADPTGTVVQGKLRVVYVYRQTPTPELPPQPEQPLAPAPKVMNYRRSAPVPPRMRTQARPIQRAQAKATLPQTGDSETSVLTALGMVSLGLAGFAVTGLKKRF